MTILIINFSMQHQHKDNHPHGLHPLPTNWTLNSNSYTDRQHQRQKFLHRQTKILEYNSYMDRQQFMNTILTRINNNS